MPHQATRILRESIPRVSDWTPQPFACSWTAEGADAAWVTVLGELDIATAPKLAQTLREARSPARLVVLDLREVAFLDSASVHAIVDESVEAREAGRRIVVMRAPPDVDRIFALTGTCDHVELLDLDAGTPSDLALQQLA